jgi:hypothetical protein
VTAQQTAAAAQALHAGTMHQQLLSGKSGADQPERVHLGGEKALFRAVFKPRFRWGNIKTLTRPENAL